jgi:hypothetical protein
MEAENEREEPEQRIHLADMERTGKSERRWRRRDTASKSRYAGGGGGREATTAEATNRERGKERTAGRRFHNRGFRSERTLAASEEGRM